jgi:hypothetical protein
VKERGWTLDVLNLVRRVCSRSSERQFAPSAPGIQRASQSRLTSAATDEFTNEGIYAHARELEVLADGHQIKSASSFKVLAHGHRARCRIIDSRWPRRLEISVGDDVRSP